MFRNLWSSRKHCFSFAGYDGGRGEGMNIGGGAWKMALLNKISRGNLMKQWN